jgi:hypothetical protein
LIELLYIYYILKNDVNLEQLTGYMASLKKYCTILINISIVCMDVDNLKVYLSMNSVEFCLTICIRYLIVKKL